MKTSRIKTSIIKEMKPRCWQCRERKATVQIQDGTTCQITCQRCRKLIEIARQGIKEKVDRFAMLKVLRVFVISLAIFWGIFRYFFYHLLPHVAMALIPLFFGILLGKKLRKAAVSYSSCKVFNWSENISTIGFILGVSLVGVTAAILLGDSASNAVEQIVVGHTRRLETVEFQLDLGKELKPNIDFSYFCSFLGFAGLIISFFPAATTEKRIRKSRELLKKNSNQIARETGSRGIAPLSLLQQFLLKLTDRYPIRYLEKSDCYVGVHHGICFRIRERTKGLPRFLFVANSSDAALEEAQKVERIEISAFGKRHPDNQQEARKTIDYTHLKKMGIPTDWITSQFLSALGARNWTSTVSVPIEFFDDDDFESLPEILDGLLADFTAAGIGCNEKKCSLCEQRDVVTVLYIESFSFVLTCQECYKQTMARAEEGCLPLERQPFPEIPHGYLRVYSNVNWRGALWVLGIGAILTFLVRGLCQSLSFPYVSTVLTTAFLTLATSIYTIAISGQRAVRLWFFTAFSILSVTKMGDALGYFFNQENGLTISFYNAFQYYFSQRVFKEPVHLFVDIAVTVLAVFLAQYGVQGPSTNGKISVE